MTQKIKIKMFWLNKVFSLKDMAMLKFVSGILIQSSPHSIQRSFYQILTQIEHNGHHWNPLNPKYSKLSINLCMNEYNGTYSWIK